VKIALWSCDGPCQGGVSLIWVVTVLSLLLLLLLLLLLILPCYVGLPGVCAAVLVQR